MKTMVPKYWIKRKSRGESPRELHVFRCRDAEKNLITKATGPAVKTAAEVQTESDTLSRDDIRALKNLARYYETTVDYLLHRKRPLHVVGINLLSGMAKGFGIAIGITVIAFIAFRILNRLEILNLPLIGDFIAELLDYIESVQRLGNV